jgi:hypothetical protein
VAAGVFDWVEFRTVGRHEEKRHILQDFQCVRVVPTGLVQDHNAELAREGLDSMPKED